MDKKTKGSWLVHQTGKLQNVNNQANYESIYFAGKAGILLSALSTDETAILSMERVKVLAKASNITTGLELPSLLDTLKKQDLIDLGDDAIEVLGVTTSATLQHATDIFESRDPSSTERAAIDLSEACSLKPVMRNEVREELGDKYGLSNTETAQLLTESEEIGFVDVEDIDDTKSLLFNGNLFRREDAGKVHKVLSTLNADENSKVIELNDIISSNACVTTDHASNVLGAPLFDKLSSIGLYDVSVVSNNQEAVGYMTKPSAFSKFSDSLVDDAFDLAKAFVSSLMYGMTRSSYNRGQITMIEALLRTLIRGEPIGPVNAIGNDYKVLELKGVVKVYHGQKKGRSGYMMKLLKKEVGVLAYDVITKGDASEQSLTSLPSAAVTRYSGPEENRERKRRKQLKTNPKSTNDMLLALRTGGGFS